VFRVEVDGDVILAHGNRSSEKEVVVNSSKLPSLTRASVVATFGPNDEVPIREREIKPA
jgi:hypothetical protein